MLALHASSPRLRVRLLLAVALLVLAILPSTVAQAQRARDAVTVTFWTYSTDATGMSYYRKEIALFEKAYPNITIKLTTFSDEKVILTAVSAGNPPDAALFYNLSSVGDWAQRGALVNLDPLIQANHLDMRDFTRGALRVSTYNGHLYVMPVSLDSFTLFVNLDLFHAAGLTAFPKTTSELAADALKLTKHDASGRMTQLGLGTCCAFTGQAIELYPLFNGSPYDSVQKKVTPDNPGMLNTLRWETALIAKMGTQSYFNFTQAKAQNPGGDPFIDGHVAMALDGEWMCGTIPLYMKKKFNWTNVPPPYADGHPEYQMSTFIGGALTTVPTGSKHPNEAAKWLWYLTTPQEQLLVNALGGVPVTKSAAPLLERSGGACESLQIKIAQGARAFPWPVLPVAGQYRDAFTAAEDKILRGQETPEQGMAQVKGQIQSALDAVLKK